METKSKKSLDSSKSVKSIKGPVSYIPGKFGFDIVNSNPLSIKIAILDTGLPNHADISCTKGSSGSSVVDLLPGKISVNDMHGHATLVSGILCSSNPNSIMGMCPSAKYYFCKVMDDIGSGETSNLTAGILWALSNNCDIILMSNGSAIDDRYLKKAIEKCMEFNKIVIAASGREITRTSRSLFPAAYDGVICCSSSRSSKCNFDSEKTKLYVDLNIGSLWSTFLNDSYIKCGGSSVVASIVCGAVANFMQNLNDSKKEWHSIEEFMKLFYEKFRNK